MKTLFAAFCVVTFGLIAQAYSNHDHQGTTHLKFANGEVHAHVTWVQGPQAADESTLRIEWMNGAAHTPAEPPGDFKVELWMPDMGHGSSPTQNQKVLDQKGQPLMGVYDVTSIYFLMRGQWDVNVSLTLADGTVETQTIKVEIVQ